MSDFTRKIIAHPDFSLHRAVIIEKGARVEKVLKYSLACYLGIKDANTTKSFGQGSDCLSFNQFLNMYLDVGGIERDTQQILIEFASIRNRFAHDIGCFSFLDFLRESNGIRDNLERRYKARIERYELNDENAAKLMWEFFKDLNSVLKQMIKRVVNIAETEKQQDITIQKIKLAIAFDQKADKTIDANSYMISRDEFIEDGIKSFLKTYINPYQKILNGFKPVK